MAGLERARPGATARSVKQSRVEAQTYAEYGLTDELTVFGKMAIERYALGPPEFDERLFRPRLFGLRRQGEILGGRRVGLFLARRPCSCPGRRTRPRRLGKANAGGAGGSRVLAGTNFGLGSWPGFVDAELGYRLRTAGPPDEWHADLTAGLKPSPGYILMLQNFTVVSTASSDKNFAAWRSSVIEASVVVPFADRWSLQVGLFTSVLAVKTNTERGVAVAVWGGGRGAPVPIFAPLGSSSCSQYDMQIIYVAELAAVDSYGFVSWRLASLVVSSTGVAPLAFSISRDRLS